LLLNACPRGMLAIYSPIVRAFGSVDLQHVDIFARKITNLLTRSKATSAADQEGIHHAEPHQEQEVSNEAIAELLSMPVVVEPPTATVASTHPDQALEKIADTPVAPLTELPAPVEPTPPTETPLLLPPSGNHEHWPWIDRLLALSIVAVSILLGWMISASYHYRPERKVPHVVAPEVTAPAPARTIPAQSPPLVSASPARPPLISASQSAHTQHPPARDELVVYEKNRVVFRLHSRLPDTVTNAHASPPSSPASAVPASEFSPVKPSSEPDASHPAAAKVTGGEILYRVPPVAPPEATRLGLRGDVVLQVTIAKDGTVGAIRAVSGDSRLVPSAIDAVRQWRYQPFLQDGIPSEVQGTITIHFGTAQQDTQNPSPATPPATPQ
jgi:protein TonB